MIDPLVGGAIVTGGSAVLGGLFSNKANKKIAREQMQLQREFAQHGLSWRVQDARDAGLHPLAALGAQLPSYSPVSYSDSIGPSLAEAGQNVGRAVSAMQTPTQRQAAALALQAAQQQLLEGDARIDLLRSEAERNRREALQGATSFPVDLGYPIEGQTSRVVPEINVPVGTISPKSPDVIAHTVGNPSVMAGETPFWRAFTVSPGVTIRLPGGVSGDASEPLESLAESPALLAIVMAENARNPKATAWLKSYYTKKGFNWRAAGEWLGNKLYDWFGPLPVGGYRRFPKE